MINTATTVPWTATVIQVPSGLAFRSIDRPGVAESDPYRTSTSVGWTARRMLNDIYSRRILEFAADIPLQGTLPDAHGSAKAHSKLCGSTVTVYLKLDGNVVSAFTHEVKACALGQASSSIMGRHVIGSTAEELRVLREAMHRMLKAGGDPPSGKWADLALLEPARNLKARHASILLTFDAVVDALAQAQAARKEQAVNDIGT
jgi:NifU-like protein involved in Fe-S cluster formation